MFKLGNTVGKIGEDTACVFLMKQGFTIKTRNYWKKWGEIDIVAEKKGIIHFVEVKALRSKNLSIAHKEGHRPEDNVHFLKQIKLRRVITSYIAEKRIQEGKWQFDIVAAYLDPEKKQARIDFIENIIL